MTRHITLSRRCGSRAAPSGARSRSATWACSTPRSTGHAQPCFGQDAYPELLDKAAALLHSLARKHPLVDGNTRLAWLATYVFCAKNAVELDPDDDAAYALVVGVAAGPIDDVATIAKLLESFV